MGKGVNIGKNTKEDLKYISKALKKTKLSKKTRGDIVKETKKQLWKQKTLNDSIKEGGYAAITTTLMNSYVTPFALAIGSSNVLIGFLNSFANLFSPLTQLFGSGLLKKYSRKNIVVKAVFFQALFIFPFLLIAYLFYNDFFINYLPYFLIIFYSLFIISGAVAIPAWFSLIGDVVPENRRGRYFSKRNQITGAIALIFALIAAFTIDYFESQGLLLLCFGLLFFIAGVSRFRSYIIFKGHYDEKLELKKIKPGFISFLRKNKNFKNFLLFILFFSFGIGIAGPFFTVYMLEDLGLNYLEYILIHVVSMSVFTLVFLPIWGRFSDKFGNREMLKLSLILIILTPILWIFNQNIFYLIFVPQLLAGVGWAAFNLGTVNFVYDSVSHEKKGLGISYFHLMLGFGLFLGMSLGGYIADYLYIPFMNKFLFLFLVSGVLRLLFVVMFFPFIKEVKKVKKFEENPNFIFKYSLNQLNYEAHHFKKMIWHKRKKLN